MDLTSDANTRLRQVNSMQPAGHGVELSSAAAQSTAARISVRPDAIATTYGPLLDEAGLTYPQYVTLLALWEDPERSRSVGELGERLHLDSGTLTPLLKRLASMGYVTRARDADDERRVLVTLTAEGLTLRERLAGVPESFLGCLGLDAPEADALRDQLAALTALLERGTQEP